MRRLRVLIDANVLVDAQLRDLFLSLADRELIEYLWTESILGELHWVLVERLGRPATKASRLCDAIRRGFPLGDATIDDRSVSRFATPDPQDAHVLAAAVLAEADMVVTYDRAGFPEDTVLTEWDLQVISPGEALDQVIALCGREAIAAAFADITTALQNPRRDLTQQLRRLEETSPVAAVLIGDVLGLADYRDLLADAILSSAADNPRAAVARLIDCVGDEDLDGIDDVLTDEARKSLGRTRRARHRVLSELLRRVLEDRSGWSFGTAHRPHGVNKEIVKLVWMPQGGIVHEPIVVEAIIFSTVLVDDRWMVNAVGIPDPATG